MSGVRWIVHTVKNAPITKAEIANNMSVINVNDPFSDLYEPIASSEPLTVVDVVAAALSVAEASEAPVTASTVATPPRGLAACQSSSVIQTTGEWLYQSSPRTALTVNCCVPTLT